MESVLPEAPQLCHPHLYEVRVFSVPFLHAVFCPQVSNQGQSLNTLGSAFLNIMWPHEIANGKWLLYPMRVELEGGQGPGQKGLCSPRPNTLQLVRLRQEWVGCDGAGILGVDGGEKMQAQGFCIWSDTHWSLLLCIQDVDNRDRRRRELEQPEQQESYEQQEPSTSWWPVSYAEKKRNITLVRVHSCCPSFLFKPCLGSFVRPYLRNNQRSESLGFNSQYWKKITVVKQLKHIGKKICSIT